jgi:hypothetical protein
MHKYFCTLFDINYISFAKALFSSLNNQEFKFTIFAFCMDEDSYNNIIESNLPNVVPINLIDLENKLTELGIVKKSRTKVEFYYTCSPAICKYVLEVFPFVDEITYLDSDLYFFCSPIAIFKEIDEANASVGIIEHRFSFLTKRNIIYGRFNVGWITFKKDNSGLICLNSWYNDCINWCFQKLEGGKYADQKYLDNWPIKYDNIRIINNVGANVAIWNIRNYTIKYINNKILINDSPLIFYHFANLEQISFNKFKTNLSRVFMRCSGVIKKQIYIPYVNEVKRNQLQTIKSKNEISQSFILMSLKQFTRKIRQIIFSDEIKSTT